MLFTWKFILVFTLVGNIHSISTTDAVGDEDHVYPQNMAVLRARSMTMPCRTRSKAIQCIWKHDNVGIHNGMKSTSLRYQISTKSNQCDLTIENILMTDAGNYTCEIHVTGNGKYTYNAQLIVLDSVPSCGMHPDSLKSLKEGDRVEFRCSVQFNGSWCPEMEWSSVDGRPFEQQQLVTGRDKFNNSVTSSLRFDAISGLHGARFQCLTHFKQINHSSDFAENTPVYQYLWNSSALNVIYRPYNLTVIPLKDIYHPGEVIRCSAIANPEPSYEWIGIGKGWNVSGPDLSIDEGMVNPKGHKFRCVATNWFEGNMVGKEFEDFLMFVQRNETGHTVNNHMHIIVPSVVLADLALITIIFVAVYMRLKKKSGVLTADPYQTPWKNPRPGGVHRYSGDSRETCEIHRTSQIYDEIDPSKVTDDNSEMTSLHTYVNDTSNAYDGDVTPCHSTTAGRFTPSTTNQDVCYTGLIERDRRQTKATPTYNLPAQGSTDETDNAPDRCC